MKKEYFPYYISRVILSSIFSFLVLGFTWKAGLLALVFFGLFLLYLHSGWFGIDLRNSLVPLRRDSRGQKIQRKALIYSVVVGLLIYLSPSNLSGLLGLTFPSIIALSVGILTYFVTQFILFSRT